MTDFFAVHLISELSSVAVRRMPALERFVLFRSWFGGFRAYMHCDWTFYPTNLKHHKASQS